MYDDPRFEDGKKKERARAKLQCLEDTRCVYGCRDRVGPNCKYTASSHKLELVVRQNLDAYAMYGSSIPGASTLKYFPNTKPLLARFRFARYFCDQLVDRHRLYEEGQLDAKVRNVQLARS